MTDKNFWATAEMQSRLSMFRKLTFFFFFLRTGCLTALFLKASKVYRHFSMCLRITTHLYPLIPTHSLAQKQTYPQKPDSHSGEPAPPIFTSLSVIQPHPFHLMAVYGPSLSLPHSTVTPDQRALRTRDDAHFTKGFPQGN